MESVQMSSYSNINIRHQSFDKAILVVFLLLFTGMLPVRMLAQAQVIVTGMVRDSLFHAGLPGAIVTEGYTGNETITDAAGRFSLKVPMHRTLSLAIAHNGFVTANETVITSTRTIDLGEIFLRPDQFNIRELYKLSDRATWRDPVTYQNRDESYIDAMHGMVQFPDVLDHIPGVYVASMGGQHSADRLRIRGFGAQHISVMLNGVPIHMTGSSSIHWSGMDGFPGQSSTIQVQRGMNNSLQYTPYAGGAVNMITEPANLQAGGQAGIIYGEGNLAHATMAVHSGMLNNKIAVSLYGSRTTSDGIIDGTWTEAWNYYLTMTYAASDKHRIEINAMGAPQRYGQAPYMQHIAAYSHNFATEIGVSQDILDIIPRSVQGRYYNQGLNQVDPGYTGEQYWNGKKRQRHAAGYMNENEYYGHAPFAQINWYASWSDRVSQQTTFYYSALEEGSAGVSGDVNLDYSGPSAFIDYNSTIAENQAKTAAEGILGNSVRDQMTLGAHTRLNFRLNHRFNSSLGINASRSGIQQYQEVRDLLGGGYYYFSGNEFDDQGDYEKQLGAIIGYHKTKQYFRIGFSGDIGYTGRIFNAYASGAYSMVNFRHTDLMKRDPRNPSRTYSIQPEITPGFQFKSGLSFRLPEDIILYSGYSYVSQDPSVRLLTEHPEIPVDKTPLILTIQGIDAGIRYAPSPMNGFAISVYDYMLTNSTMTQKISDELNNGYLLNVSGIDQRHRGIELDMNFRPIRFIGIEANGSLGRWVYADDATGTLENFPSDNGTKTEYTFRIKDLRTGNAPQLQAGAVLSVHPVLRSYIKAGIKYYGQHFASWNPAFSLNNESQEVWEIPGYYLIDLHAGYTLLAGKRFRISLFGHVFNLLDEYYIPDALNNGAAEVLQGVPGAYENTASSAHVFIGLPRTFNAGINVAF